MTRRIVRYRVLVGGRIALIALALGTAATSVKTARCCVVRSGTAANADRTPAFRC